MPNDITGSYHAIPIRPARVWQRARREPPRHEMIIGQILGATRWAKPPPGVAWRRAMLQLLLKLLGVLLLIWTVL